MPFGWAALRDVLGEGFSAELDAHRVLGAGEFDVGGCRAPRAAGRQGEESG
jgi:hypothetical protein